MGADIKNLRIRIHSVDSTMHLTRAMGLVASSKMRRACDAMEKGRRYADAVSDMTASVVACPACKSNVYLRSADEGVTKVIVIAGDRGLCGGYNASVFRFLAENGLGNSDITAIGKRAYERFGKGYMSSEHFGCEEGHSFAEELCRGFREGEFDRLILISTKYHSMMSQEPVMKQILPLTRDENRAESGILFEPGESEILGTVVPEYVFGILMAAVRESFASEVAARRTAMDSAEKNAQGMMNDLAIRYNRARQGAITQEITEIVAGSGG